MIIHIITITKRGNQTIYHTDTHTFELANKQAIVESNRPINESINKTTIHACNQSSNQHNNQSINQSKIPPPITFQQLLHTKSIDKSVMVPQIITAIIYYGQGYQFF